MSSSWQSRNVAFGRRLLEAHARIAQTLNPRCSSWIPGISWLIPAGDPILAPPARLRRFLQIEVLIPIAASATSSTAPPRNPCTTALGDISTLLKGDIITLLPHKKMQDSRRGRPSGKHVRLALSAGQILLAHGAEEDADGEADQKVPGRM